MRRLYFTLLTISGLVLLAACSADNDIDIFFALDKEEITIKPDGGSAEVVVYSNYKWVISGTSDWCTPSVKEGNANEDGQKVTFSADVAYDDREALFWFRCADKAIKLVVKQSLKEVIIADENNTFDVPTEGGPIEIAYQTNVECKVVIPDEAKEWITIAPVTKGLVSEKTTLLVATNTTEETRSAVIKVVAVDNDGLMAKYMIKQDRGNVIKVTYTLDFEEEEFQSKVATAPSSWSFVQEGYGWQDEQTSLCHTVVFSDWYAGGGLILSRYNTSDPAAKGTYESDLYVYNANNEDSTTGGGYDGSNTFLIANGNYEPDVDAELDLRPEMTFADGKPRTIRECWVNSTSYFVNIAENGNAFSPAMKEGEEIRLYATGYDAQGREGRTVEFSFARKGALIKEWTRWDLASLGEVVSIKFNIRGGNTDDYGMTTPKYFAIDHIVVEER